MTKEQILSALRSAITSPAVCKVSFSYRSYEDFLFPVKLEHDLFMAIAERDFLLDGFVIRQLSDVESVQPLRGTYLKIHKAEGNLDRITAPPIPLTGWRSVFSTLGASSEVITIERESLNPDECAFVIGRILAVGEQSVRFRGFDGAGNWDEHPKSISYDKITGVTFGSRYIATYTKYIRPYPEIQPTKIQ